ncbi:SAM-dependent methyltransferase [Frankia gtarii]|uniref:SAM-dependent methyltransferase n=1 Tax=Frankia gtarii TaxID=2950102 RepID=UPI0027E063D7|nr:SAM-dependent methyltransferase [Frankia gtarii]
MTYVIVGGVGARLQGSSNITGDLDIVLTHARALLTSTPAGRTAYLDADLHDTGLHDTDRILAAPELRATLDLTQPIALSLIAIFHFIPGSDTPYSIVRRLVDALPSGSYLTLTHITADYDPGVDLVHRWRPEGGNVPDDLTDAQVSIYGGIARKR